MRSILIGSCFILAALQSQAQKGLNSIYSSYGIGDLEEKDYSRSFGVGSSGIARSSSGFLNELNPASYAGMPMETFYFEASLAGKAISYTGANLYQPAGDINFKRVAMGFKASKAWGMSFGIMPYSRVDYKLVNTRYIEGTTQGLRNAIEGTGGINRLYWSNGVKLSKNFSIGVSSAFLFGPVTITDSLGSADVYTEQKRFLHNFNFTTGLQYFGKAGDWTVGAGATYRFKTQLRSSEDIAIKSDEETTLFQENLRSSDFTLPEQWGGGLSLSNGKITWLADYRQQNWKGSNDNKQDYQFVNAQRYSGGVEYSFFKYNYSQLQEHLSLQMGINYQTSYMRIKNEPVKDFGITAGASLPSKTGHLRYYMGVEVGQRGTAVKGLVQENYFNVVLHLSLRDNWFFKRREL